MKTAIYIEDGTVQLVITPETEFEKNAMRSFSGEEIKAQMFNGCFYDCRGGWVRQKQHVRNGLDLSPSSDDNSLILRMDMEKGAPDTFPPPKNKTPEAQFV